MSRLDLVIFGATGFTGKHAVEQAGRIAQRDPNLTWAIAGRSRTKLEAVLQEVQDKTGENLSNVRVIVADVGDEESLKAMSAQAKVIANCCGPYRHYGEPVVKACIATKTHHVDVSGEPQYIESVQLKYHKQAEEAGVYIISACGLDCLPNDMGVVYLKDNFKGVLNSVESYMTFDIPEQYRRWGTSYLHYGSWATLVDILATGTGLQELGKKLGTDDLPRLEPMLKTRYSIQKSFGKWFLPFVGTDKKIVNKTQRHFYEAEKQRPIQFEPYGGFPSLLAVLLTIFVMAVLTLMSKTAFTRKLLLEYPRLFSLGFFSHEGPPEETMKNTTFAFYLRGQGWDDYVSGVTSSAPDNTLIVKVSGVNPGYGATAVALLCCGITILKEQNKMPGKGGVLTTGAAFSKTSLIKALNENNFIFQVIKN